MITFKAVVISTNKRKDGTYPVKIRVTFKGVSRRLPTTMAAGPNDLTRSLKIKSANILSKSNALIDQMRAAVGQLSPFELEEKDVDWVVAQIKKALASRSFRLDFFDWAETVAQGKSESTGRAYRVAINSFARFLGRREIDINDITRSLIIEYMAYLESTPKHSASIATINKRTPCSIYIFHLKHIHDAAKLKYNDEDAGVVVIPRSPFNNLPLRTEIHIGERNLGIDLMQRIISYRTDNKPMRQCLDAFIVSFALMGANLADLYAAPTVRGHQWRYNRQKTRTRRDDQALMIVDVPKQAEPFIARLQEAPGKWWLPVIHTMRSTKDACTSRINEQLKIWCRINEVEPFTFYAARHSWASIARTLGEKATVDECLGHVGDFKIADIYAERDWAKINGLNKAVLELFEWPDLRPDE